MEKKRRERGEGRGLSGGGVIWRVCVGSEELEGKEEKKILSGPP